MVDAQAYLSNSPLPLLCSIEVISLVKGPKSILKYLLGSGTRNTRNMVRAGNNNTIWGVIGGAIVGGLLGTMVFPVIGSLAGAFVGGLLGSTVNYARR